MHFNLHALRDERIVLFVDFDLEFHFTQIWNLQDAESRTDGIANSDLRDRTVVIYLIITYKTVIRRRYRVVLHLLLPVLQPR